MEELNARERYIETLTFGQPDKIPFIPGGPRKSTLARWRKEGLDEGMISMRLYARNWGLMLLFRILAANWESPLK